VGSDNEMGVLVGLHDGTAEVTMGVAEGVKEEGTALVSMVGLIVGFGVGDNVDRIIVGSAVGVLLGLEEVTATLGVNEGTEVFSTVGEVVGRTVGLALGN
jgi:hypothetical protein